MRSRSEVNLPKLLWSLMTYRAKLFILSTVSFLPVELLPLVSGLILRAIFDGLSGQTQTGLNILTLAALFVAVALVRSVFFIGSYQADIVVRFSMSNLIRHNLLRHLLVSGNPARHPSGEVVNRLRDDADLAEDMADEFARGALNKLIFAAAAITIMLLINARVAVVVFVPVVAVVVLVFLARSRLERFRAASRKATGLVSSTIGETFEAVETVKVSGAELALVGRLREQNQRRKRTALLDSLLSQGLSSLFNNTVSIGTGLILILAAADLRSGAFSVGDFALFVFYLGFVTQFVEYVGSYLARYRQSKVAFERMADLAPEEPPEMMVEHRDLHLSGELPGPPINLAGATAGADDSFGQLQMVDVSYRYDGSEKGLDSATLSVACGSVTVVTGRIGSGKTTLLRLVLGLLKPIRGSVTFLSPSCQPVSPNWAYASQIPQLFSASIRENVLLDLPATDAELTKALETSILKADIEMLSDGLETQVGVRGQKLSGGQQKRVSLARAFVRHADLFVLDDPTSGLDATTEDMLVRAIGQMARFSSVTLLIASHRKPVLRLADQIVLLKEGRVEGVGSLEDLLERSAEMRELWADEPETPSVRLSEEQNL